MLPPVAHQRKIADLARTEHPRERLTSLVGYSVETITKEVATPIILKYEWLGDVGRAKHFAGLYSPERELLGVACFGYGPAGATMRAKLGGLALCLERGACVPHAPPNAASFLISHACHLMFRLTGVSRFFAYGDPMAGEYGGVYQATNWIYLGQGLDGGRGRKRRYYVVPPGLDPNNPRNWRGTRELRRPNKPRMDFKSATAAGYTIGYRDAKHVYAVNVGRDATSWRRKMNSKTYPKPREINQSENKGVDRLLGECSTT